MSLDVLVMTGIRWQGHYCLGLEDLRQCTEFAQNLRFKHCAECQKLSHRILQDPTHNCPNEYINNTLKHCHSSRTIILVITITKHKRYSQWRIYGGLDKPPLARP